MRAMGYVARYRRIGFIAYGSLFVATAAQLMVPQVIQTIIDAVVQAFVSAQVLKLPSAAQAQAAKQLGTTLEALQAGQGTVTNAILLSMLAILGFAVVRAVFSFSQTYNAERVSQNVAYDLRKDIFGKIQRLSFSYHDQNQTGQLMIRATDDVEKVRLFIGQGLVMTLQAFVLLVGTLIILWFTNHSLTLVILPILPIALVVFMVFGAITQPLFTQVQTLVGAQHGIAGEPRRASKSSRRSRASRRSRPASSVPRMICWCSNSRSRALLPS